MFLLVFKNRSSRHSSTVEHVAVEVRLTWRYCAKNENVLVRINGSCRTRDAQVRLLAGG